MDKRIKEIVNEAVEVWCQHFEDYVTPNIVDIQLDLYDIATDLDGISDDEWLAVKNAYRNGEFEEAASYCLKEYKTSCREYEEWCTEREREYRDMVWGNQKCPTN